MAEKVDDITINYEEDGIKKVEELKKEILTRRGVWTTIVFLYREFDKKKDDYGPPKASIRRYKKMGDTYRQQSKFNITNAKQAMQVSSILNEWFVDAEEKPSK